MEILTVILSLCKIAECLVGLKNKIAAQGNRERFVSFLKKLSSLVAEVEQSLRQNQYPHDKCGEMSFYLGHVEYMLKPIMGPVEIEEINSLIKEAHAVERLFGEMQTVTPEQRETNLNKLKEISGMLQAAAVSLEL